jgi:hypothetical protein
MRDTNMPARMRIRYSGRPWDQTRVTIGAVAGEQPVNPARVHAMCGGELSDRPSLPQVRLDEIPAHVHRRLLPAGCRLCLDTSLADVLVSDTITSTPSGDDPIWLGEAVSGRRTRQVRIVAHKMQVRIPRSLRRWQPSSSGWTPRRCCSRMSSNPRRCGRESARKPQRGCA